MTSITSVDPADLAGALGSSRPAGRVGAQVKSALGVGRVQADAVPRLSTAVVQSASGRLVAGIVCGLLLIGALEGSGVLVAWATTSADDHAGTVRVDDDARSVLVAEGDSFWSIARDLGVVGEVRPAVDALVAANGGPDLEVGEVVVIPGSFDRFVQKGVER